MRKLCFHILSHTHTICSVSNPNYFAIDFQKIQADVGRVEIFLNYLLTVSKIFYPINNTHVGGGELKNVDFQSNQQTNVTFPFSLDYIASNDPQYKVLLDLSEKCGVTGGAQSDITVNYKLTVSASFFGSLSKCDLHRVQRKARFKSFILRSITCRVQLCELCMPRFRPANKSKLPALSISLCWPSN